MSWRTSSAWTSTLLPIICARWENSTWLYAPGIEVAISCSEIPGVFFGAGLTVNEFQFRPASSNDHIYKDKKEHLLTAAVDQITGEVLEPGQVSPETIKTLRAVGIGEPKRSSLAQLAYVNPEYIQAWHAHLQYIKGAAYKPGLLIHVLETGDPAPEVSENGHPLDCKCRECNLVDPFICPECHVYPCDCE